MISLDANGSGISRAMFDQVFAQSGEIDAIVSHPEQFQAYEETGCAVKIEWMAAGGIPSPPSPFSSRPITIRGAGVHEDVRYARGAMGFLRGEEMVAQITNLALPEYN